jgi:mono/diheme cytochrome c family protein
MKMRATILMLACAAAFSATRMQAQNAGADVFNGKCSHCHGADGLANTPAGKAHHVPPFTAPDVLKMTDADLTSIIKNGKDKMPSFGNRLTDAQIQEAVGYIRTLQKQTKQD